MCQKLSKIFINNLLHLLIFLLPFIIILMCTLIFSDDIILILLALLLLIIFILPMLPIIFANIKILADLFARNKVQVRAEISFIKSGWAFSAAGVKRKYLFDIFRKNYTCIFNLYFTKDNVDIKTTLYIKRKELENVGFFKLFRMSYTYKQEWILTNTNNNILVDIVFYNFSKVIECIKFNMK